MSARTSRLLLAAGLALSPALAMAQDRAVPRGGGGGGGGGSHGGSDAGSRHSSPSPGTSSSSSSSSGGAYHAPSAAERRHPRAGTGSGGGGGYYPGYPGYGYPGWGGGWYYPGYGGYWWPYGYYGWYGSFGYGGWGYPGYGGGAVYYSGGSGSSREGASLRVLVDPAEARVYVDGYYAGVVDDFDGLLQRLHLSPGRHDVTLKLEGYKTHRLRVYVGPDATLKLHHEMQKGTGESFEDLTGGAPLPERETRREREDDEDDDLPAAGNEPSGEFGKLELTVEPEDASVYVDGAFRGTGREAASLRLAPGRHRIEVVRPGFRTAENDIEVPAGETTRIRVILDRPSI
jgi:hypothetical protein